MTLSSLHPSRLSPATLLLSAGTMLCVSAAILGAHAASVRRMQETGLPASVRLPAVISRIEMIKEQSELTELQASLRGGSVEESVQVFVLPRESDLDRLLATFDAFFDYGRKERLVQKVSAIVTGEERTEETLSVMSLTFEADMTKEGAEELLLLMDLAGVVSVADAFGPAEISLLLALTEEENPAALPALEQFLSTDLLRYALEPKPYEEQLLKSFASDTFLARWKEITDASRLSDAVRLLGGEMGALFDRQNLWPLRFMKITRIDQRSIGGDNVHVFVEVEAYGRVD